MYTDDLRKEADKVGLVMVPKSVEEVKAAINAAADIINHLGDRLEALTNELSAMKKAAYNRVEG